jgi:hypothetical protein
VSLITSRVFVKDSSGKIVCRREGVWSSEFDRCQGCGTTEKPHEGRGLCHPCYVQDRYRRNVNGTRDKSLQRLKALRMADPEAEAKDRAKAERQKSDPHLRELRRIVSNRYADKVSAWPLGTCVEVLMGNLAYWSPTGKAPRVQAKGGIRLKGEIAQKSNTRALVRFATFEEWVPFARLIRQSAEAKSA